MFGDAILKENFSDDLIGTVSHVFQDYNYFTLKGYEGGGGINSIEDHEFEFLKLVEEVTTKPTQPKIIQLLSHDDEILGLGDDGVIYNQGSFWGWEEYYPAVFKED